MITALLCRVFQNLTGGGGKEGVLKDTATPQPMTDHSFRGDLTPSRESLLQGFTVTTELAANCGGRAVEKMSRSHCKPQHPFSFTLLMSPDLLERPGDLIPSGDSKGKLSEN